jgi:acyl-coenzyme A synthetase/AMP-(fatty) acid ligase
VELGELEHAIAQHPHVRECAAVLDGESLCAYYVAEPDPGARALRAHCASRLPAYMIPAALIRLDALPRTTTGKVALAELAR